MRSPFVSVIIPAYNGGDLLVEAIQSVLNQTYPHFELIVVDDLSPEPAELVVRKFNDRRLRCIIQQENQGAVAARRAGVHASSGEIIAFLDQDDLFHPEKLQTHVAFLNQHPEIDITYNSRFEINLGSESVRGIWVAPQTVTLTDLVMGFPFSPSDTVLRREAALREDIWDQSYVLNDGERIFNGGEIVFGGRLALAGCRFANVGRALNYRRYHPRRIYKGLSSRCKSERTCQEMILDDPRCPKDVQAIRDQAIMNTYLVWTYYAFAQGETAVGQEFLREAVHLNPSIVEGKPCKLVNFWVLYSAIDESIDPAEHLDALFSQLPVELSFVSSQLDWGVAYSYLIRGMQAVFWDNKEWGHSSVARAAELGAQVDNTLIDDLTYQLMAYKNEFGELAVQKVVQNLSAALQQLGSQNARRLKANYNINQAFKSYRDREYDQVAAKVIQALRHNPKYLLNRGVMAMLYRSTFGLDPS